MSSLPTRHSIIKSVILHLLPGILVGICYYAIIPILKNNGYPSAMALTLSGLFVLCPFVLFFLLTQKKVEGTKSVREIIFYKKPMKVWEYIVYSFVIILLAGLAFKAFGFASDVLKPLFDWMPSYMVLDMGLSNEYLKSKLITTYILFLLMVVVVLPIVEEVYFRGYLLPRMPLKLKSWDVLVHSGLFALYHTWTPWLAITRAIGVLPLVYLVKRKQNIYIGMIAHCLINSIDFIIGLLFILKM